MAEPFDSMLEPGERVVGRWRGGWLPDLWPNFLMIFVLLLAIPVIWVLWEAPWQFLPVYAVSLIPILSTVVHDVANARATRSLLTDRRLLHRTGWRRPKVRIVPLGEITDIVWFAGPACGALDVLYAGGKALPIPLRRSNATLPEALAQAAKLPVPPSIGPARMAAASLVVSSGYLAGPLVLLAAAVAWLPWAKIEPFVEEMGTFDIAWVSLITALALGLGFVLGAVLSVICMRFVLNAQAARLWLGSKPHPGWVRPLPAFALPAALRLARLLWGAPMNPNAEAAGHG